MAKVKVKWVCQNCSYQSASFLGKCPECSEFSTFVEEITAAVGTGALEGANAQKFLSASEFQPTLLSAIEVDEKIRISTGLSEFDRVLGGGFVQGSLVLLAGDPGIGKSTLVLQAAKNLGRVLYVCAEESTAQVKLRAQRLDLLANGTDELYLTPQNCLEEILLQIEQIKPDFIVVDSIQSVFTTSVVSTAGSVSQIRECTNLLTKIAKQKNITTVVIGHVTKEGNIAGPKVLEHMVDCVINFEGDKFKSYRLLRAIKNRFGATSEVGVFNMEDEGLVEISNPSEVFLRDKTVENVAGSTIIATLEGTRVLMLEIQALTGSTPYPAPRRVAVGVEYNRLLQILAVLEKRVGLNLSKQDVYINVIGGIDIVEPAVDLGIAMAVLTCARDVCVAPDVVFIGEIGLSGEIRSCSNIEKRLKEAHRLGFKKAIIPQLTAAARTKIKDIKIETVEVLRLVDAISKGLK